LKPTLREVKPFTLADYPEGTAYEAGFLVTKNSGWRSQKPIISERLCTGCLQCYLHCPDGVIFQKEKVVDIDYDFCKGCGICIKICQFSAIEMGEENA
jgi:pyruvate ferredoxin oxidoreductase delta subunit/pyruvate ferredoxin oxidoreductase gamma subunit